MKERPILYTGEMVRAILEDRKTKTRRVIRKLSGFGIIADKELFKICPYGQVGDHLWVRETFASLPSGVNGEPCPVYRATDSCEFIDSLGIKWTPSIFMPRWASRITLEITNISVERVQDISEEDAIAEGCLLPKGYEELCKPAGGHRAVFRDLWDSINAKRGFGWDSNPLVWVISFKLIERNNDAERTV